MKRIISIILMIFCLIIPVAATTSFVPVERTLPLLVDDAGLLSDSEYSTLLEKLESISESRECEVAVITVNSTEGYTAEEYADDIYDYYGFGYGENDDGMLLLLDMGNRKWHITTYGFGAEALNDSAISSIGDKIVPYLSDGDYYDAFTEFADQCDWYIGYARDGGSDYEYSGTVIFPPQFIFGSIIAGFVIALIATGTMRSKLKTIRSKSGAADYTVKDSLKVTRSSDIFLYRNVTKTAKPDDDDRSGGGSSMHTSSSGRSHGGGGGSF